MRSIRSGRIQPALTDAQVVQLAQLGRPIEAHFGQPQDIEWCLDDDGFQIVQSRPITTLFPIPDVGDQENHVFISVGHGQMMTDAMKPLGISFWQLTTPRPMYVAGGRLFVDVAPDLGSPTRRAGLLDVFGEIRSADRGRAARASSNVATSSRRSRTRAAQPRRRLRAQAPIETDPAIVEELIRRNQASIAALKRDIRTKSGSALFDFILADIQELKRILFDPRSHQVFMSAMDATWWLNEQLAGVAGREERRRHAHPVRSPQRHVGDGSGAPGRRGRDPSASAGSGLSAPRRGRRLPG